MKRFLTVLAVVFLAVASSMPAQAKENVYYDTRQGNEYVNGKIGANGVQSWDDDAILENGERTSNGTDGVYSLTFDDDAVELGDIQIKSSNTSTEDNNYLQFSWWIYDDDTDEGALWEAARQVMVALDVTSGTEDAALRWAVSTAGTIANELELNGASLNPTSDEGLDLGASGTEFKDAYIDGTAYLDTASVLELIAEKSTVALTSPTKTIDVSNKLWIEVSTDANQTGATFTNGTPGQIFIISSSPTGSNTLQFDDDGVNMALGANKTITEGQTDVLIFLCTATDDYALASDQSGN